MNWAIYLIVFAVSAYAIKALTPKPPVPKPDSLKDIEVPTAEAGRPIPVAYGTVMIKSPNVVWYGDLDTSPIKSDGSDESSS